MLSKVCRSGAACVVLVAAVTACNSPAGSDDQHIVPVGLVILQNGTQIVAGTSVSVDGSITATGLQTQPLTVQFLNIEGQPIDPGVEYHLDVLTANSTIATWEPEQVGAFTGRVAIRATGTTMLRFRWMHGPVGSAHVDLTVSVPVNVTLSQDPD